MKIISLNRGLYALVDDEDLAKIMRFKWFVLETGVAAKHYSCIATRSKPECIKTKQNRTVYMHHLIIGKPTQAFVVDHINGNALDNRRSNLRIVSKSINCINRHQRSMAASGSFGVSKTKNNRFRVMVVVRGKARYVGTYDDRVTAAKARDEFVVKNGLGLRLNVTPHKIARYKTL